MESQPQQAELDVSQQNQNNTPDNLQQVENKIDTASHNVVDAATKVPDDGIKNTLDSIASSLMQVKESVEKLGNDFRESKKEVKKEDKKEDNKSKSPVVKVDNQEKYKSVRRRGGRIVKRKI